VKSFAQFAPDIASYSPDSASGQATTRQLQTSMASQKKQRVVAYAYDNPIFEGREGSRTEEAKQDSPGPTKIDVGPEQEPEQVIPVNAADVVMNLDQSCPCT
jgi:hypothetical protein